LANYFRWFCISKNSEKAIGRLVDRFCESNKFALSLQICLWGER